MDKIKKYFSKEKLSETMSEWKWLFRYITRYKKGIILYIIVGVIGVLLGLWSSIAGKDLINTVINKENGKILGIGALVIGLALAQIVTSSVNKRQNIRISSTVTNDLRQEIFGKILNSKWEYLSTFHTGEILNRLEGDVNCIAGGIVSFIPNLVTRGVQFIGVFCIILYYDPAMAFISLGSAPILFFSSRYLMRIMRKYNERMRESNGDILAYNEEVFQNIQLVKAFDLAPEYSKGLDGLLVTDRRLKLEHNKFSIITHALFAVLGIVVAYLCYGWGVYRLWTGRIDYGVMTLFLQLAGTLRVSFSEIVSMIPTAISTATSAGRVIELTTLPAETDADGEKAEAMLRDAKECGVELFAEGLCFTYRGADESNLNGIGFTVKPGETVAFVGPSGGGKTTTLRLILALLEPEKGRLEVRCGDKVLPVSESTRRLCSYVPQGNQIFSGTIAGNLRVAAPDASDDELWQALEIADARSFVEKLPDGLYTELRERGENLSEGQRQRIAIARAVLKDAPILVMDEATSALDAATENRVLRNLMKKNPRRICVITTHRKSMLEFSHRVYEISGGNINKITDINDIGDVKEREEA